MKRKGTTEASTAPKKSKSTTSISTITRPSREKNENGESYWQISNKRRVTVQDFKGATLIALREFYEKDGKTLPGKQGISLNVEQFTAFVLALPDIKKCLAGQGLEIEENLDEKDEKSKIIEKDADIDDDDENDDDDDDVDDDDEKTDSE